MAETPLKPRRRWFRFSLRTLFVVVTISGLGLGWLGLKAGEAHRQRLAIEAIESRQGTVWYDYEFPYPLSSPPGPRWLRELIGDDYFASIVWVAGPANPEYIRELHAHWKNLPQLRRLELLNPPDSDTMSESDEIVQELKHSLPNVNIIVHRAEPVDWLNYHP